MYVSIVEIILYWLVLFALVGINFLLYRQSDQWWKILQEVFQWSDAEEARHRDQMNVMYFVAGRDVAAGDGIYIDEEGKARSLHER